MPTVETAKRLGEAGMFIGGQWRQSSDGATLACVDPATEEQIATIPDASDADVDSAVVAARAALDDWRDRPPGDRATVLFELAGRLQDNEVELAEIDAVDSGNPIRATLNDIRGACREIRMFAGLATEIKGDSVLNGRNQFAYGRREPYGVVGRIIPFNHPLKFAAGKTCAALVAGNTVLLKPSEQTSLSALRLGELTEGLLPPGVLNVVTGRGDRAGAAIAAHPGIPRVAFTGGVGAGKAVLRAGVDTLKHVSLELGGKNPMIVFPDVDVDKAAQAAVDGMNLVKSQGQSCQSNSRIFVHRDIHQAFVVRVLDIVGTLSVGDPQDYQTDIGPLAYRAHYDRVLDFIRQGKEEGANLVTGGVAPDGPGLFLGPTVFDDVRHGMTIASKEIFGPVLSVMEWDDYETMVAQANDTPFGLTANIWTKDIAQAHLTAHRIEAGYVWINGNGKRVAGTPFGGYKQSGLGKEGSLEEVLSYTQLKVIAVGLQT